MITKWKYGPRTTLEMMLYACPFCESTNVNWVEKEFTVHVQCGECDAEGPKAYNNELIDAFVEAGRKWNYCDGRKMVMEQQDAAWRERKEV